MSDFVPPDLLTEILAKVPVKSILRCRCVCKKWRMLISNPNFTSKHLSLSPKTRLVRHYSKPISKELYNLYPIDEENKTPPIRIGFPFNDKSEFYFHVVGSCNGVLCLSDDLFGYKDTPVVLWNPSIRRAVVTPVPKFTTVPYMSALGFGFVAKTNDYKVVRVAYINKGGRIPDVVLPPLVEVFSLLSNVWKVVKRKFVKKVESFIPEHFWSQAVVGNVVHWVSYKLSNKKDKYGEDELCVNMITIFDLESERFGDELGVPEPLSHKPPMSLNVVVLRGLFSLLSYNEFYRDVFAVGDVETSCSVWVMRDYGDVSSWTELYKVSLERGVGKVLGLKREGELMLCDSHGELFTYNCENKEFISMGVRGTRGSFFIDEYVESLVLLGKGKSVGVKKNERDCANEDKRVVQEEHMRKLVIAGSNGGTLMRSLGFFQCQNQFVCSE